MVNIAVIGDIHIHFTVEDVDYLNASEYDLILVVGDLSAVSPKRGRNVGRLLSQLRKPTLFIAGNHDAVHLGLSHTRIRARGKSEYPSPNS
jgi:predicted phosphodiesterase